MIDHIRHLIRSNPVPTADSDAEFRLIPQTTRLSYGIGDKVEWGMFIENTGELTHEIDLGGYVIRLYHLPDNSVTRLTASLGVAASDLQGLSYAIGETYVQAGPRPTVEMWMTFSYGLEEVNLMPGTVCWDRMRSGVHPGTIEKPELSVGLYIMKARFGSIDTGVIAEGYAVFEVGLPKDQVAQPIRQAASCTREIGQATGERLSA